MPSSPSADDEFRSIDQAKPFKGVVVCCTSIPPEQRTEIGNKVAELGGVHKYDLTPDCTHLIVGDYNTPKYRHVARERPDVKAMAAAWIEAVSEIWRNDGEIDFGFLEKEHRLKPLDKCGLEMHAARHQQAASRQSLLICLTGFGDQRDEIAEKITGHGALYTGDLTRRCSHLIVCKPEGKKFTAAKSWGLYTVTLDWLHQSLERGMILEESKFDPLLPPDEQGSGAWITMEQRLSSLGKRARPARANGNEDGVRKLRKTASIKLGSQRTQMLADMLGRSASASSPRDVSHELPAGEPTQDASHHDLAVRQEEEGLFSSCLFAIYGFDERRKKVLEEAIVPGGGRVVGALETVMSIPAPREPFYRFLIVPQASQPDTHPHVPSESVHVVTEFYIERCLQSRRFFHPTEQVLGRPFPRFPILGFSDLTICSSAFTGIELNQVARTVVQLGAKYDEDFKRTTSLVLCNSLQALRKDKRTYALEWGVPVVSADWLWKCISTGFLVPFEDFIFPEFRKQAAGSERSRPEESQTENSEPRQRREPARSPAQPRSSKSLRAAEHLSASDFNPASLEKKAASNPDRPMGQEGMPVSADFMTAKSRPANTFARDSDTLLNELSHASLNKCSSFTKQVSGPARAKLESFNEPPVAMPAAEASAVSIHHPSTPPPAATAAEAKRAEAEDGDDKADADEARNQAKALERKVLSSKLTSLLPSPTAFDSADSEARPRRRQILGRATSNVSNASSAGAATADVSGSRPAAESLDVCVLPEGDGEYAEGCHRPPPATQLEYHDQEALIHKKALIDRMMSGSCGDSKDTNTGDGTATAALATTFTTAGTQGAGVAGVAGGRTLRKR
ncbi:BRCT domain-containing protein [Drechmeria coniospora]|uniref:BRCT domain-containing protein n=1 Tax=Drechmeria coniospora TaxID=98403 RepID=A0A151GHN8_DRECN|nr:BRCT domain-containing protein [Drechmeria coniospora]KYK56614.1 BRCT domain-containing protein [Drechmeria coniospora]